MKNYLSFGGGVNSVALYLLMKEMGFDFEAVFVDHGGDWPETYEYIEYFKLLGHELTVLNPIVRSKEGDIFNSIIEYCLFRRLTPSRRSRWCTDRFKIKPIYSYIEAPCFMHLGIDAGESSRAVMSSRKGVENRFLLIEEEIDRAGCVSIIKNANMDVPAKSGCYICPFQSKREFSHLKDKHPDLFSTALEIENAQNARVTKDGRQWKPYYLSGRKPLSEIASQDKDDQNNQCDISKQHCICKD